MDDFPWIYVAMIFIAFLSWLINQVKEAAAARREKMAERQRAARAKKASSEYRSPYRVDPRDKTPEEPTPPPMPTREAPQEPPRSFADVFREIERQFTEAAEPEPTPPPLPRRTEIVETPEPPQLPESTVPEGLQISVPRKSAPKLQRGSRETASYLGKTLRDGKRLKTALILREVLGPPRSRQSGPLTRI